MLFYICSFETVFGTGVQGFQYPRWIGTDMNPKVEAFKRSLRVLIISERIFISPSTFIQAVFNAQKNDIINTSSEKEILLSQESLFLTPFFTSSLSFSGVTWWSK